MSDESNNKRWWQTLPVILGAVTALITAVAGLLIAFKSVGFIDPETKKESPEVVQEDPGTANADKTKGVIETESGSRLVNFEGSVGKLNAVFNLSFDRKTNKVQGTYFYKKRQNMIYVLKGIIDNNRLELTEYTSGRITATCVLRSLNDGCYDGKMNNTDGREFGMALCKISGM